MHESKTRRPPAEPGRTKGKKPQDYLIETAIQSNRKATRNGAYVLNAIIAVLVFALALALASYGLRGFGIWVIVVALVATYLVASCLHINMDWERSVVVRFGKFSRVAGPGLFFTLPLMEFIAARVDQRTMATPFTAEETLTSDLVPVNVDAVLFWMV